MKFYFDKEEFKECVRDFWTHDSLNDDEDLFDDGEDNSLADYLIDYYLKIMMKVIFPFTLFAAILISIKVKK